MSYQIYGRINYHFMGNNNPKGDHEVHDLHNEKPQCEINVILANQHAVAFSPDTLDQAHREKFDNCDWCIGDSKR